MALLKLKEEKQNEKEQEILSNDRNYIYSSPFNLCDDAAG